MALWQFKFSLLPVKGIAVVHGEIPAELWEYQPPALHPNDGEPAFPDYWRSAGISPASLTDLTALLPPRRSWSPDAQMYGSEDGDSLEIWLNDIDCRLDMRSFCPGLLERILSVAHQHVCKVVISGTGEVVDPDVTGVLLKAKDSEAFEYCSNPDEYVRKRRGH